MTLLATRSRYFLHITVLWLERSQEAKLTQHVYLCLNNFKYRYNYLQSNIKRYDVVYCGVYELALTVMKVSHCFLSFIC